MAPADYDSIFVVGSTQPELGGSEYYEGYHNVIGGIVPRVDLKTDKLNRAAILNLIRSGLISCAHDCSKGGIAISLAEMAIAGSVGMKIDLNAIPNSCNRIDELLFSETHSRYLVSTKEADRVRRVLASAGASFAEIGIIMGTNFEVYKGKKMIMRLPLKQLQSHYDRLENIL
jgi:phosphoribosylformylglycinamidine synthase